MAYDAEQAALKIAGIGFTTVAEIRTISDKWYVHDWRGKKGEPPKPRQLVEFASLVKSGKEGLTKLQLSVLETRAANDASKRRTNNFLNGLLKQ